MTLCYLCSLVEIWYVLFVWCEMFRTTCNTNIFLLKNFNSNSSKPYDNLEYLPMKMGNLYKIYSSLSLEIWELFLKYGFRSEVFDIVFCLTFSFYILWWLVIRMRPRNFNLYKICCVFSGKYARKRIWAHIKIFSKHGEVMLGKYLMLIYIQIVFQKCETIWI